ncbi:MAG: ABC transporter ATP-binding protein [Oscillospiraceae bacterium]|nr:ABC transporter ATP-binding protein [Oscillospiraceae bacterium]
MELLTIKDLSIHYHTEHGDVQAVNNISLTLNEGEVLGLVGETGAGKTTTALGIMGLLQSPPGKVMGGEIWLKGQNVLALPDKEIRKMRGETMAMIYQDPMSALNPVLTVGDQIMEVILQHSKCKKLEAEERMIEILEMVGIPGERAGEYPHQFSGGMKQRVVIAIALACKPDLLIADEPTTALDVTIQAQVLRMSMDLRQTRNTAMLLIPHDLGIGAQTCDKVAIMYAGEIVEYGSTEDIFEHTSHPYTKGLFDSIPKLSEKRGRLKPIPGMLPDPVNLPDGCKFHPRCPYATEACSTGDVPYAELCAGHFTRCRLCRDLTKEDEK